MRDLFQSKPEPVEVPYRTEADPYLDASAHDESNWLVSYADMMTLLCGFFIMLFSVANVDTAKYQRVQESLAKQFGGQFEAKHEENARFLTQVLTEKGVFENTLVKAQHDGVMVILQTQQFFDSLSTEISAEGMKILAPLVSSIRELEQKEKKKFMIQVEGHSDSRPILSGPFPSNWELSSARAGRVVRYFVEQKFPPHSLTASGFADTRPEISLAPEKMTEADHARNRRVVIRVIEPPAAQESLTQAPADSTGTVSTSAATAPPESTSVTGQTLPAGKPDVPGSSAIAGPAAAPEAAPGQVSSDPQRAPAAAPSPTALQ